jgi:hypothetical protein
LQISSANALLDDPQKIFMRLFSVSLPERFFSGAAFGLPSWPESASAG